MIYTVYIYIEYYTNIYLLFIYIYIYIYVCMPCTYYLWWFPEVLPPSKPHKQLRLGSAVVFTAFWGRVTRDSLSDFDGGVKTRGPRPKIGMEQLEL